MAEKTVVQLPIVRRTRDPLQFSRQNICQMYAKLEKMGKKGERIATRIEEGRKYDIFECEDGTEVWFDITDYIQELMELIGAARKSRLN